MVDVKALAESVKKVLLDAVVLCLVFLIGLIGAVLCWAGEPSDYDGYVALTMLLTPAVLIISSVEMCILQYFALGLCIYGIAYGIEKFQADYSGLVGIGFLILVLCQLVSLCCTRYLWSKLSEVPQNFRRIATIFAIIAVCVGLAGAFTLIAVNISVVPGSKQYPFIVTSIFSVVVYAVFFANELIYVPRFTEVLIFLITNLFIAHMLLATTIKDAAIVYSSNTQAIIALSLMVVADTLALAVLLVRSLKGDDRQASPQQVLQKLLENVKENIKSIAMIVAIISGIVALTGVLILLIGARIETAMLVVSFVISLFAPVFAVLGLTLHTSFHYVQWGIVYALLPSFLSLVSGKWEFYTGYLLLSIALILSLCAVNAVFHRKDDAVNEVRNNQGRVALLLLCGIIIWLGCVMCWSQPIADTRLISLTIPVFLLSIAVFLEALVGFAALRQTIVFLMALLQYDLMFYLLLNSQTGPLQTGVIFIVIGGIILVFLYAYKSYTKEAVKEAGSSEEQTPLGA